jgi:hypothetical protein
MSFVQRLIAALGRLVEVVVAEVATPTIDACELSVGDAQAPKEEMATMAQQVPRNTRRS